MIESREQLIHVLTEAAEVEHNLLCSYLYAAFSLKRSGEPGLTDAQATAVERWRKTVVKISLQEMAHLACVNNLLIAVGGSPHFDRPNFPVAPGYLPAGLVVRLTPFDRATLDHFIFLERPAERSLPDGDGFEEVGQGQRVRRPGALTPSARDYDTVGELYEEVAAGFTALTSRLGEAALIDGDAFGQIDSELMALPDVRRITDLESALAAIRHIKEEGEGSTGVVEVSHFDRFTEIRDEWSALSASDPDFQPAWPAAHDPVMRRPAPRAERVWITAEPAAGALDLANALYATMLQLLSQSFMTRDRGMQARLMKISVEVMEASAAVATALARLPAGDGHPGVNAGITFAVPRNLGFRPRDCTGLSLFEERIVALAAQGRRRLTGETQEKVARRLGAALTLLAAP